MVHMSNLLLVNAFLSNFQLHFDMSNATITPTL
jgi:hypothetical protein